MVFDFNEQIQRIGGINSYEFFLSNRTDRTTEMCLLLKKAGETTTLLISFQTLFLRDGGLEGRQFSQHCLGDFGQSWLHPTLDSASIPRTWAFSVLPVASSCSCAAHRY